MATGGEVNELETLLISELIDNPNDPRRRYWEQKALIDYKARDLDLGPW